MTRLTHILTNACGSPPYMFILSIHFVQYATVPHRNHHPVLLQYAVSRATAYRVEVVITTTQVFNLRVNKSVDDAPGEEESTKTARRERVSNLSLDCDYRSGCFNTGGNVPRARVNLARLASRSSSTIDREI
jgi:hypothetical protein